MRMRESMHNSGALRQQRTMSFSCWAASSDRNRRADLCQLKVSEWHICISKPITKTLWITLGILEFNMENGSPPGCLTLLKNTFPQTPELPPNDTGFHVPSPVLPPLLYLTVCLSSSEDLICALNMSLWISISWRRFCIAYNDRGNNQLNITFKNRIGSVGSLQIRGILQCKRWYYEKRSPAILNVETERELGRVKKWFQGRWIS